MAISVTNLGSTADGSTAATFSLTGITVPNAAVIAILTNESALAASSIGSLTDGSNTYTSIMNGTVGGPANVFYAWNVTALSGGSLTYHKAGGFGGTFGAAALSAFYATGLQSSASPLDTAVSTQATGTSTTGTLSPTVTGGALSTSGELVVGGVAWSGSTSDTFTQASSYATPFEFNRNVMQVEVAGGNRVSSASSAHTYAPTIATGAAGTVSWIDFIVAFKPSTAVVPSFGWFAPLTIPSVMTKPGLRASQQMAMAAMPHNPTVPFGWFRQMNEPVVKTKPMLRVSAQQAYIAPPFPPVVPFGWFEPLSEPVVKIKLGLRASLQMAFTGPPRLLPTPTIRGTFSAFETGDTMLFAGLSFARPTTAMIGVVELAKVPYVGIVETKARPGVSGVVESHTAPVSGSPVTAIASAAVGIRII